MNEFMTQIQRILDQQFALSPMPQMTAAQVEARVGRRLTQAKVDPAILIRPPGHY